MKITCIVIALLFSAICYSQTKLETTLVFRTAVPINNLLSDLHPGIGPMARAEFVINKKIGIGASAAYLKFWGRNREIISGNFTTIIENGDLSSYRIGLNASYRISTKTLIGIGAGYSDQNTRGSKHIILTHIPNTPFSTVDEYQYSGNYFGKDGHYYGELYMGYKLKRMDLLLEYSWSKNAYAKKGQYARVVNLSFIGAQIGYTLK